jgi:glycosyl transferase family 25
VNAFLINLGRRPDRLAAMTEQLGALEVPFTRIEAVDAQACRGAALDEDFVRGPLGELSRGDKACTLSHMKALEIFLETGKSHGLILEDDVALSPRCGSVLRNESWLPAGMVVVKLERFGPPGQRVVVAGPRIAAGTDCHIARLASKHCGAAAYIVSRAAARMILDTARPLSLPVDHLLFNPNNSPLFGQIAPWQLFPAIAEQRPEIGGNTDIHQSRLEERPKGWRYIRREATRGYYEFRNVPTHIRGILTGRARLERIRIL